MYLPKSKYGQPKYTRGDEFALSDGTGYVGWYFLTYEDKGFTGRTPSKKSERLYRLTETDDYTSKLVYSNDFIAPKESDYQVGYFTRYFLQDDRNKSIIEVNKQKYTKFSKLSYINPLSLKWDLSEPYQDIKFNGYIYYGSKYKNKKLLEEAEKAMKGISALIKSYDEFEIQK